jgi:integrase
MVALSILPTSKAVHTTGHIDCPACSRALTLDDGCSLSPVLCFRDAFKVWLDRRVIENAGAWSKVRYISERTERDLRQYARAAGKFFDDLRLEQIHAGHFREYQKARAFNVLVVSEAGGARETKPWQGIAGANLIRKEVQLVTRIMRAAGAWSQEHEETFELVGPDEKDVARAMTPSEQQQWLRTAASRPEWRLIYAWSILALQTTASTNEMRALRIGDIYLGQGTMQIRSEGAKNKFRVRTIPLQTPEVVWALGELLERAKRFGSSQPHHYLFPFHIANDQYDPLRPMTVSGIRKPWDAVRSATGLDFTPYGLRHTAITRMAEAGVPIQVIMSFAGHIRAEMQQHYTAISMQAKRRWAAAAWAGAEMPFAPGAGLSFGPPAITAAAPRIEQVEPAEPILRMPSTRRGRR